MTKTSISDLQSQIAKTKNRFKGFSKDLNGQDRKELEKAFKIMEKIFRQKIQSKRHRKDEDQRFEDMNLGFIELSRDQLGDTELMDSIGLL